MPRRSATAAAAAAAATTVADEDDEVALEMEGDDGSVDGEASTKFADQVEEEMNEGAASPGVFKLVELGCKLDERSSQMLELSSCVELLGVGDYVRRVIGEDANEYKVLQHNLQDLVGAVHKHVRRFPNGAKVKEEHVELWTMHMVRAGVYKKSPTAVARSQEKHPHDPGYLYLKPIAKQTNQAINNALELIGSPAAAGADFKPSHITPEVFYEAFKAVSAPFARVLQFVADRLSRAMSRDDIVKLLVSLDDWQMSLSGKEAAALGLLCKYIKAKTDQYGFAAHFLSIYLTRLPVGNVVVDTQALKAAGVKLRPAVVKMIADTLSPHVALSSTLTDSDRAYTAALLDIAEKGGHIVSMMSAASARNHRSPFGEVTAAMKQKHPHAKAVAKSGPATTLFRQAEAKSSNGKTSVLTFVGHRQGDRLPVAVTTLSLANSYWCPNLERTDEDESLVAKLVDRGYDAESATVEAVLQGSRRDTEKFVVIVESARTPAWRIARYYAVTSTTLVEMVRLHRSAHERGLLLGEDDAEFLAGLVDVDDDNVDFVGAMKNNRLVLGRNVYERARRSMDLLERVVYKTNAALPPALRPVAHDAIKNATVPQLQAAVEFLDGEPMTTTSKPKLMAQVKELAGDYNLPGLFPLDVMYDKQTKNFRSTAAMEAGTLDEPRVREAVPKFLVKHGGVGFRFVLDASDPGLVANADHRTTVSTSDGGLIVSNVQHPDDESQIKRVSLEIKTLSSYERINEAAAVFKAERVHRLRVAANMSDDDINVARVRALDDPGYVLQCLQHAAAEGTHATVLVIANHNTGEIMGATLFEFDDDLVDDHHIAMQLMHKAITDFVLNEEAVVPEGFDREEQLQNYHLAHALHANPHPHVDLLKPSTHVLHSKLKAPGDMSRKESKAILPDMTGRKPLLRIIANLIALVSVSSMRMYRAFRVAAKAKFKSKNLRGLSVEQLQARMNDVGSTDDLLMDALRQYGAEHDVDGSAFSGLAGTDAAGAASDTPDGLVSELVVAVNRGVRRAEAFEHSPDLRKHRLDRSVIHGVVKLDKRKSCVLDCSSCAKAEGEGDTVPHNREHGTLADTQCSWCGVVLSRVTRAHFGNRSAWDVWHGDKTLPAHNRTGYMAPVVQPLPGIERTVTESADKRRNTAALAAAAAKVKRHKLAAAAGARNLAREFDSGGE